MQRVHFRLTCVSQNPFCLNKLPVSVKSITPEVTVHCSPRIYRREIYFYKFVEVEVFLRKLVILVSLETNFFPQ